MAFIVLTINKTEKNCIYLRFQLNCDLCERKKTFIRTFLFHVFAILLTFPKHTGHKSIIFFRRKEFCISNWFIIEKKEEYTSI